MRDSGASKHAASRCRRLPQVQAAMAQELRCAPVGFWTLSQPKAYSMRAREQHEQARLVGSVLVHEANTTSGKDHPRE